MSQDETIERAEQAPAYSPPAEQKRHSNRAEPLTEYLGRGLKHGETPSRKSRPPRVRDTELGGRDFLTPPLGALREAGIWRTKADDSRNADRAPRNGTNAGF